jgi:hypothetical protein
MKKLLLCGVLIMTVICGAQTVYVNNVKGNDKNDGSKNKPVASIWQALKIVKKSGVIDVANTGKPYQTPYYGPNGRQMNITVGGTAEKPLEIRGNGAVITGLSVIPENKWSKTEDKNIYSLPFWPMSNFYKGAKTNYWPDTSAKIWWVNRKAAPNCLDLEKLKKTPGGFWWNKAQKKVLFHLPEGKKLADLRIELPANSGFYILVPHVVIRDFYCIFSWNDGFDTAGLGYDGIYRNCIAVNNCGQGFSCHAAGSTLYEDCAAISCNSSGSCDVDQSFSRYMRCIFLNNTYEAGIHTLHSSQHYYADCIIAGSIPFEQIWLQHSSSQQYFNCLIEGTPGFDLISFKQNSGSIAFRNCTIRGGKRLFALKKQGTSSASFKHCIIGGTVQELFNTDPNTFTRLTLEENVYCNVKNFIFKGTAYTAKNFDAYKKLNKKDAFSVWLDKEPNPGFRVNKRQVGANLPSSVLKRYEKLKKIRATAAGIHFEK